MQTVLFGSGAVGQVIFFANKLVLIDDIQFLARGELFVTHHAGETVQVKDFAPRSPDQVTGRDALGTACTLGTKTPGRGRRKTRGEVILTRELQELETATLHWE